MACYRVSATCWVLRSHSTLVVVEAIRLGVSRRVLFRMLRNVGLEALVGVVPVLGDVFDIAFKANLRNTALLKSYIEDRLRPTPVLAPHAAGCNGACWSHSPH